MKKISWKTLVMMLVFVVSFISLLLIAFAPLCLTWSGSIFLLVSVTLAGYSFNYLNNRYERLFK